MEVGVLGLQSWSGRSCEEKLLPLLKVETNSATNTTGWNKVWDTLWTYDSVFF